MFSLWYEDDGCQFAEEAVKEMRAFHPFARMQKLHVGAFISGNPISNTAV